MSRIQLPCQRCKVRTVQVESGTFRAEREGLPVTRWLTESSAYQT